MQIGAVRTAIAAAVQAAIPALEAKGFMPMHPPVPSFCMEEVRIEVNRLTFKGVQDVAMVCYLFASTADDQTGQALLDTWLSDTGASSVLAALYAQRGSSTAQCLGGAAKSLTITGVDGYRMYEVGDAMLYGARINVRVIG